MSSIKDVAKRAQVGSATVSRVLNGNGYVSEDTKIRIQKAMKELDYTPNELARNLFRKKTGIIAVLVPTVSYPFFAEFVDNVEAELHKQGYKTMLCNTSKAGSAELEYLEMLDRHIVDGIISGVHSLDVEDYQKLRKPIVALDRYLGADIPVIAVNHKRGGRLAAEKLIQSGCRHVLHFRGTLAVESPYHDRHYEFDRVMESRGIEVFSYELEWNRFDYGYFEAAVADVLKKGLLFDGVFGADLVAIQYRNEVLKRGMRVPEDIKIVAYDGTYITRLTEPRVTAIVQPIDKLAVEAVRLLCGLINGKIYQNKKVALEVEIQEGGTTIN